VTLKYAKCVCGRGSAPDPAGGAHDAPDPLVVWGGDTFSPHPILPAPAAPRSSHLRCSPVGDPHNLTNRTLHPWRLDRGPRQPSGPRAPKHVKTALPAGFFNARAMHVVLARYWYRKTVCPSVCPSGVLRYRGLVWTSSKLITRIISLA